jgi:hypothetical protein
MRGSPRSVAVMRPHARVSALRCGSSHSIVIPCTFEILGSSCFSDCGYLSSIAFHSNSGLTGIESDSFSYSKLQSVVIPVNVSCIDGSAFSGVNSCDILSESGNERFVFKKDFLIDVVDHKLIRNFSILRDIKIPSEIEILGFRCFSECKSLLSISFE